MTRRLTTRAAIGLGSNLDQPQVHITQAFCDLETLAHTRLLARSSLYQSQAVGPEQPDYINACALLDTELSALDLLDALQAIEHAHQRVRDVHWGPRTLDLDLLLYGQQTIDHPRLTVPHAFLRERNFVIVPLFEIWPDAHLPNGESLASLKTNCTMDGLSPLATHKE